MLVDTKSTHLVRTPIAMLAINYQFYSYQQVDYFANEKQNSDSYEVLRVERGSIEPGDSDIYADVPIKIKAVVPTITNCNNIKVTYRLKASVS